MPSRRMTISFIDEHGEESSFSIKSHIVGEGLFHRLVGMVLTGEPREDQCKYIADFGHSDGLKDNKIPVIKLVRQYTGLGLKEARDLVESISWNIPNHLGRDFVEQLIALGVYVKLV